MKIIRFLILSILFTFSLFANVQINAPQSFIKEEPYLFTIEVSGDNIKFPRITHIDGNVVQEVSSSTSTNIINSTITKKIKRVYSLYSAKDFIFPKLEFVIDGKTYYSQEKLIKAKTAAKTQSDIFDLSIRTNKNELFVGEDFILTITLKYKRLAQIVDLNLLQPNFENFWYKPLNDIKQYDEGEYKVQEISFLLFALKQGIQKVNPVAIQAQVIDPRRNSYTLFSNGISSLKIYSNELNLDIKPLPSNIDLIGDFEISASIDKTQINKGDSLSYKLEINGTGNFDDIKDIKLDIQNATIYENKPEIKTDFKDGKYYGVYNKVFSIIPNASMTIPSVKLSYFDKKRNEVITKSSENFHIKVVNKNESLKQKETLEKKISGEPSKQIIKVVEKSSIKDNILYFSLGIITMSLILSLYFYVIKQKENKKFNEKPLVKKVKSCNTKDELLKTLCVYLKQDSKLDKLIFEIETTDDISSIKKELIKLLKEIDIKGKVL